MICTVRYPGLAAGIGLNAPRGVRFAGISGLALAFAVASAPAMAQGTDEKSDSRVSSSTDDSGMIVVTAQRRAEVSTDVPVTLTSISAETIEQANVNALADIARLTPSLRFDRAAAYTYTNIRGIGTNFANPGAGATIGIYVDGYYRPTNQGASFEMLNVKSVQVLKGPQGTLFGRNTPGGAILIETADPSTETSAVAEASYARFNTKRLQGYFTTGISDKVAFDFEGLYSSGDSFTRNIFSGKKHAGAYENWTTRIGMKAELSDSASFVLRYTHSLDDDPRALVYSAYKDPDTGAIYSWGDSIPGTVIATKRGETAEDRQSSFRFKTNTVTLTGNFDLGFADLTSYTMYRAEDIQQFIENDYSSANVLSLSLPETDRVMSQELLLTSKAGGALQYTAGIFLYQQKIKTYTYGIGLLLGSPDNLIQLPSASLTVSTYAGFADATYEIADNLFLTGGLRYSRDTITNASSVIAPDIPNYSKGRLTPRAVIRYKPTENSSIYASFSKGHKSAVLDFRQSNDRGSYYLLPETVTAYEVGYKFANSRFSTEISGFWMDYKNIQNSYNTAGRAFLSNAAASRIKGIEGQVRFDITPQFQISGSAAYVDGKYRNYQTAGFFTPVFNADGKFMLFSATGEFDASGMQMRRSPKFSGNASARYRTELAGGTLMISGNMYYTSKIYFDPAHQFYQDGYALLGGRIAWTDPSDHYTIAVFGDNLTDKKYLNQAAPVVAGATAGWGTPATYGVSIRVKM